jgi:hypothetical protein
MENNKITEGIKQMAEMFKNAQTERKAFVFMPDFEGFKVYEVSEESAKMALTAQALKDKAEAERQNEDSGLGLQHVSFAKRKVCRCYEVPPKKHLDKCDTCGRAYI